MTKQIKTKLKYTDKLVLGTGHSIKEMAKNIGFSTVTISRALGAIDSYVSAPAYNIIRQEAVKNYGAKVIKLISVSI